VGISEGTRPLGRPRHKWMSNVKMDRREIAWGGMDWIILAQVKDKWTALLNTIMNLRVPYYSGKFLSSCTTDSLSRRAQLHKVI
jgi:hypothetical protein